MFQLFYHLTCLDCGNIVSRGGSEEPNEAIKRIDSADMNHWCIQRSKSEDERMEAQQPFETFEEMVERGRKILKERGAYSR